MELWNHLKPGGSAFPYLRLLMPQIDNGRPGHYGMKEAQIADMWGAAMGLDSESEDQQRLKCYKDPTKTGASAKGDLANAIRDELKKRNSEAWSSISLETVNAILDEVRRGGREERTTTTTSEATSWEFDNYMSIENILY